MQRLSAAVHDIVIRYKVNDNVCNPQWLHTREVRQSRFKPVQFNMGLLAKLMVGMPARL